MSVLNVGPGQQYTTLASAIAASQNGDVIEVQAGTYTNDFATITDNITIEGVGGMVDLVATEAPPNGKAILVTDANVTIDNVSFSGATVPDGNGAGIRYETGNLTLNNDDFYNNQDGLLAASDPQGSITINDSTFSHNGTGDGLTHNLYVNEVGTLTIDDSTFTDAVVGHEIKSRADNTIIENSLIADGPTGTASYSIDLPNGGNAVIKNNVIEQGPESQNPTIIAYGEEGNVYAASSLEIAGNTVVNDLQSSSAVMLWNTTSVDASVTDNRIYGLTAAQIADGPSTQSGNTFLTTEPALTLPGSTGTVTAETPSLTVQPTASGLEGATVPLTITASQAASALAADDLTLVISGLDGGSLNHGTANADGSYALSLADLNGLVFTAPDITGTLDLHVVATDTESSGSASAAADILVTLTAPPTPPAPTAEPPSLTAAAGATSIAEGGSVALDITAAPAAAGEAAPTVTIAGIPTGATLADAAHDTLTISDNAITLSPSELSGLTLTPAASFTGNLALSVTATDTEPASGTSATTPAQTIDVTVLAPTSPTSPTAPPAPPSCADAMPWLAHAGDARHAGPYGHGFRLDSLAAIHEAGHDGAELTLAHILPQMLHAIDFAH